jgi:hypothetical protein
VEYINFGQVGSPRVFAGPNNLDGVALKSHGGSRVNHRANSSNGVHSGRGRSLLDAVAAELVFGAALVVAKGQI